MSSVGEHPGSGRMRFRTRWLEFGVAALVAVAFLAVVAPNAYRQDIASLIIVYALLGLGMYLPLVLAGQISLAYNVYFALGAYSVALLATHTALPVLLAVPIGALVSAAVAALLAVVAQDLTRFYLALATLIFGLAFDTWLVADEPLTGGAAGIGGIPSVVNADPDANRIVLIGLGSLVLLTIVLAVSRFRQSLVGIALIAQNDVPAAAEASGVNIRRIRMLALVTGAAIASLGGSFLALVNQFVLPESFTVSVVFLVLFLPLIGGLKSPWGTVIGAVLVVLLTETSSFSGAPGALVFGIAALGILVLAPEGLIGGVLTLFHAAVRRPSRDTAE